jgi:sec-independent protein translocase protein TatA
MLGLDNPIHILFVLVIVLLVFGAKRLPEMGRSLGSGMRGFKDTLSGEHTHTPLVAAAEPATAPVQAAAAPAREPVAVSSVHETGAPAA